MVFDSDSDDFDGLAPAPTAAAAAAADAEVDSSNVYAAYNAYYDEDLEIESSEQSQLPPLPQVVVPHANAKNNSSSDDEELQSSATNTAGKRRKRAAAQFENADDDDDFESQQSILKWVRTVPGPLQDVIKHQQATMDSGQFASGSSMGTGAMISTIFDDGPWVDMCAFLGIATTPGKLYGGIRMSSLQHTLSYILEDDQSSPKIPRLLLLVKSMKYVDEEIVAVFHDPTGEIEGYFHREIVEQLGPALGAGTGVLLRKVSVFTPTDATLLGRRRSYLNITPRNLERVFVPSSQVAVYGAVVEAFNHASAARVATEDALESESNRKQEDEAQRLLQHDALRHASTELSYLSQRQVVHRNPPVRPDASAGESATSKKAKKSKKKDSESATGLGKWEWSRLVQRKPAASAAAARSPALLSAPEPASASQALPVSRFTALLSRQIATKRRSSDIGASSASSSAVVVDDNSDIEKLQDERDAINSDGRARVRFADAPEVVEISARPPTSSAEVSENEEVAACDDSTPQPAPVRAAPAPSSTPLRQRVGVQSNQRVADLDDDDDW